MDSLSFRANEENGLSFELMFNGTPIDKVLEATCSYFPYWIATQGIPTYPPLEPRSETNKLIVGVCSCGEWGCGSTHCEIEINETEVILHDFDDETGKLNSAHRYSFSRQNFDEVSAQIAVCSNSYSPRSA